MIHALKTWPEPFLALTHGHKTHEFRKEDRPYQIGDILLLAEFVPADPDSAGRYTGRELVREVTYIGRGFGIPEGYCCMSVAPCRRRKGLLYPAPALLSAMEGGVACGLELVSEAVRNELIHAGSIWAYTEVEEKIKALQAAQEEWYRDGGSVRIPDPIVEKVNKEMDAFEHRSLNRNEEDSYPDGGPF